MECPWAPFIHGCGSTLTPGTCLWTPTCCLLLLPWLFKERPIGQIEVWLRSHSFSQKSNDIHVLFPGSSWECLFEQKILSVQKLPPAWRWPGAIAVIKCSQGEGRVGGKETRCLLVGDWQGVCAAWSEGEVWGKRREERRPLSCWGVEPAFDSVEIKGFVSLHSHWFCWSHWNLSRTQLAAQAQLIAGLKPADCIWNCL